MQYIRTRMKSKRYRFQPLIITSIEKVFDLGSFHHRYWGHLTTGLEGDCFMRNTTKRDVFIGYEKSGNSTLRVITDVETGEIIDETWIHESKGKPGRKQNQGAYFVKLYKSNILKLVTEKTKEKKLDLNEAGLFFMLISISGWQTPYIINPHTGKNMSCSSISDFLNLDRKNTHNLMERLIKKGLISKIVNGNGRANHYMINPNIVFWGKTIDDTNHLDVFKDCPFEPKVYIKYRKTPDINK